MEVIRPDEIQLVKFLGAGGYGGGAEARSACRLPVSASLMARCTNGLLMDACQSSC